MTWVVGTVIEHVETGAQRVVVHITPAGTHGTSYADGPTFHATLVGPDGKAIHRGHTVPIWSKSMSYPTSDWKAVT